MSESTDLWRDIARARTNELSEAQRKISHMRVSRNSWRIIAGLLALGYLAICLNVYVFGVAV